MAVLFEHYGWLLVLALLIGVLVAWRVFGGKSKTRIKASLAVDVLADGAAPARRNQALIDSPGAMPEPELPPATPQGMSGVGTAVAAGAQIHEHHIHEARQQERSASADDLTRIKGVGPKLAARLAELGVTRFEQIASWSEADIDRIDAQLGTFQGRIRRDSWVEQAGFLATGDIAGFEGRFGKAHGV